MEATRGGTPIVGTVTLGLPVSTAVSLPIQWTANPAGTTAVLMPSAILMASGQSTATFQITTFYTSTPEQVTVTMQYLGQSASATFNLTP